MILLILSTLVLIYIFIKIYNFCNYYHRNLKLVENIPCPPERRIFRHLYLLTASSEELFDRMRAFSTQYFPIYRISTLYVTIVNFLEPNDLEIILSSSKHLTKSKVYTYLYNWLGTGLLTSTGEKWHKRRKILTPTFHFTILEQFVDVFNNESSKLVDQLSEQSGNIIDVIPPVTKFTLQSILETAMGLSGVEESRIVSYKAAIYEIVRIFFKRLEIPWYRIDQIYNLSPLARKEKSVVKELHGFTEDIIRTRESALVNVGGNIEGYSKKRRQAMLDMLLSAQLNGADIDFEGIREEVDTFLFEGHDTTSMAISFLLLTLANLPDIQDQVLEEILSILGPNKKPTYDNLQELKYTELCIKETLRLFPSVPTISRYASEDFKTATGYFIPKDTVLHIHIYDLHRNSTLYPDPLKFDPDRFLPENCQDRHPFAYIPFSAGPRNCIGQRFALIELKAVLCAVLRQFKLEKVDGMHEIEFRADFVLRPKTSVKIKILPRSL